MRRPSKILLATLAVWLAARASGVAQCAMCKQALLKSEEGQRLVSGMNAGILFLLCVPFALVGTIGLLIWRARRPQQPRPRAPSLVRAYVELAKPRIVAMVLVTTAIGFVLGGDGIQSVPTLLALLAGIACTAGGAAVLNNYLEREEDGLMERTRHRALPRGVIAPARALIYGIVLVLAGVVALVGRVNLLTGFLGLLAAFLYVLVYTPLKRVTWLNTSIGAIPGALPPLCGWAAATGQLDAGGWTLFLILFAWQHPHFYALAWMFREDYRRAGFQMLPVVDPSGRRTFRQIVGYSVLLLMVSLLPTALGVAGWIYLAGALALGLAILGLGVQLWRSPSSAHARRVFLSSLAYLPLLGMFLLLDAARF